MLLVVLGASLSINVNISSQNVQNGASIRLTAVPDPAIGTANFSDLQCGYTEPDGTAFTQLTQYNAHPLRKYMEVYAGVASSLRPRLNLVSSTNPMILDISSITFGDEKRQFYCKLFYYDASLSIASLISQNHTLENVYSK